MWPFKRKKKMLSAEMLKALDKYAEYTPDAVKLEQDAFQYVFIYGRNMSTHPDAGLMNEVPDSFICAYSVFTKDSNLILWKSKKFENIYPIAIKASPHEVSNLKCTNVKGELWRVRSQLLFELDKYMKNTVLFERKMVDIIIPQRVFVRDKETHRVITQSFHVAGWQAWMYLGIEEIWDQQIDNGFFYEPCRRFTEMKRYAPKEPLFDSYYYFSKLEYYE